MADYKRILVAIDWSPEATAALKKAIKIAKIDNSDIDLINVIETSKYTFGFFQALTQNDERLVHITDTTQEQLEDLKKKVQDQGIKNVHVHIRFGNPKTVLGIDAPKDYHNDLIIMGAEGENALGQRMGSVASYVVRNTNCDVMVIKHV